ncbi:MAG: hypothetical protein JWO62_3364 [Acidimicrobiaceae bacterium]|jgi:hypothetical protein|nr:hypothetical protein [Acidimicrobiaceae bacterium]
MNEFICKLLGHQEYSDEVLEVQPWLDRDFAYYAREDFREVRCVRCGGELTTRAA